MAESKGHAILLSVGLSIREENSRYEEVDNTTATMLCLPEEIISQEKVTIKKTEIDS